jgi:1-acyl-sn-glycerol-3-phosphate acyltransferase
MLYAILKPLVAVVARLLFRLEGHGTEHFPRDGAVMVVANHVSFLDSPLVGALAPRHLSFMAKAELFAIPLFGRLIHSLNARPVRREGADPAALRTALRLLQEGRTLLVFPEGTRGEESILRPPKAGAGMLAVLSGATVVPVYIAGSGRAWPRGHRLPRPGKVRVTFGPAMRFERRTDADRKEQYEAASRAMMDAIARLKDIASPMRAPADRGSDPPELEAVGGVGPRGAAPNSGMGGSGKHE